jgi:hypothetical protein
MQLSQKLHIAAASNPLGCLGNYSKRFTMSTNEPLDRLRDALKQFISEKRILGVQKHDGGISLVTDATTAAQLNELGLASKHMGAVTRAALSDTPLRLADKDHLIAWDGNSGLIAAFGDVDKAMGVITAEGITLAPYEASVVAQTSRDTLAMAQRGGRVGVSSPRTVGR